MKRKSTSAVEPTPAKVTAPTATTRAKPVGVAKRTTVAAADQSQVAAPPLADRIRDRAYGLWEASGRPVCDGIEFWLAAEREIMATEAPPLR